ncbi:dihydroxyacetone kinase phosphoryl donor subunit DhaM [Virgibacillus siamensis]|uniref:dihydroxyacetone kinase phosphoryl donor subunit DhaM n=1 Tax=Virgibacillus siamensis TaxID=480071 RepID=UPI000985D86C|nr:dihydroxyacetone kinase phosphoryl donor subunit DhaM [Virgibacillus siamensis]
MAYTGLVLISHSPKIAEGIKDMIRQVILDVPVELAGGTEDNEIGTNAGKIQEAIERADNGNGVLLFYDIGSAKMNAEIAIEMTDAKDIRIAEAPVMEGAYLAAVESGMGKSFDDVYAAVVKKYGEEVK